MKRLVIAGPLPDRDGKSVGGVAEFDLMAAKALAPFFEVIVVTATANPEGDPAFKTECTKGLWQIKARINQLQPDYILSSLQYSFPVAFAKGGRKLHFVHGFVNAANYPLMKRLVWWILNKLVQKRFDLQVGNSAFTQMINREMLTNPVDQVLPLAIQDAYFAPYPQNERDIDVIYVGRIVKSKGIAKIIRALQYLPQGTKMTVVGDGADRKEMEALAQECGVDVTFVGSKPRQEIINYYRRAQVFVSLNAAEPFGLTYIEALTQGCKILCPITGGQVENLLAYRERVEFVSQLTPKAIGAKMTTLLAREVAPVDLQALSTKYSSQAFGHNMSEIIEGVGNAHEDWFCDYMGG